MSTLEIILVVGFVCIVGAIRPVASALVKLCGAVDDLKECLNEHLTFKIPRYEDGFDDPLNGEDVLQQLYWAVHNLRNGIKVEVVERKAEESSKKATDDGSTILS